MQRIEITFDRRYIESLIAGNEQTPEERGRIRKIANGIISEGIKYGYISAPYKDAGGKSPSHWTMLENVKPGDVIFHGLSQCISAISVATSQCFTSTMRNGITEGRRVNCSPVLIKHTIATSECLYVILETCTKYKYQPFDKNGNGRQGYLFDLNDKLAGAFTRVLAQKNPDLLRKIPQLAIMLNY